MDINNIQKREIVRIFDQTNAYWSPQTVYNELFLKAQQNYFQDRLRVRGHLFLNEVYDALGMHRTSEGALLGWVYQGEAFETFLWRENEVTGTFDVIFLPEGQIWDKLDTPKEVEPEVEPEFEHVFLVAVSVVSQDRDDAQMKLMEELKIILQPENPIECWWIAEDDRLDGSDCDSAIFVPMGSQKEWSARSGGINRPF